MGEEMSKAIEIVSCVVYSNPKECMDSDALLRSKDDAIKEIQEEIEKRLSKIPDSCLCSIVIGSKDVENIIDSTLNNA